MLRIGTRCSRLAVLQAENFAKRIRKRFSEKVRTSLVKTKTLGDKLKYAHLAEVGGKGLFLKELEEGLIEKKIDIAVHSMKDVPAFFDERLTIACFLPREDPRDAFISATYPNLESVPKGTKIATSSIRRSWQLKCLGLDSVPIRGNVDTRLAKLDKFEGMVLALSGLKRLGLVDRVTQIIPVSQFLPAIGQGIICVQVRKDDTKVIDIVREINDADTSVCARAERAIAKAINGDCSTPMAGLAILNEDRVSVEGILFKEGRMCKTSAEGNRSEVESLGKLVGEKLLAL